MEQLYEDPNYLTSLETILASEDFSKQYGKTTKQEPEDDVDALQDERKEEICQLYVDGSFNETEQQYGWAYIIVQNNEKLTSRYGKGANPRYISSRQIGGETVAVLQGLDEVIKRGFTQVEICYDYIGIEKWVTGQWKTSKPISQAYAYYFELKSRAIDVRFHKIRAHSGNHFNEEADILAKAGAKLV